MTNEAQSATSDERAAMLTRPDLLRRAGALTVALGLGSSFAPQAFASAEAGGDVKMLTWQGYDVQKAMKPFQKAHDLSFHATFIGNHDDIQAKVTQDPSGYNLITYYEGYHELYKQLNILADRPEDGSEPQEQLLAIQKQAVVEFRRQALGRTVDVGQLDAQLQPREDGSSHQVDRSAGSEVQGQDRPSRRPERRDSDRRTNPQAADPEPHVEATR